MINKNRGAMSTIKKNRCLIVGSLLPAVLLIGCVWKSDYDALRQQNQELQAQNQQLQELAETQTAQIIQLQGAIRYTINSDLLFAPGSWQIRPQAQQLIAKVAEKLAPTQQHKLIVNGYTDNTTISPELRREGIASNQQLSQKRAEAVMQYLISQGVKPYLISAHGFGEVDPVASNDTPEGRAKNRRVELTLGSPSG